MKYKIKFKANDDYSRDILKEKIEEFMKSEGYSLGKPEQIEDYNLGDDPNFITYIKFDWNYTYFHIMLDHKEIAKHNDNDDEDFSKGELEFFDKLGFEIDSTFHENPKQNIEDWF